MAVVVTVDMTMEEGRRPRCLEPVNLALESHVRRLYSQHEYITRSLRQQQLLSLNQFSKSTI